jgi:hypothetical protein
MDVIGSLAAACKVRLATHRKHARGTAVKQVRVGRSNIQVSQIARDGLRGEDLP